MNNRKIISLILAAATFFTVLSCVFITNNYAFAERSDDTGNYSVDPDDSHDQAYTDTESGNSCSYGSACYDASPVHSADAAGVIVSASEMVNNQALNALVTGFDALQIGSVTFESTASLNDKINEIYKEDPSATMYIEFVYAKENTTAKILDPVTGEVTGTKTINKDDIVGVKGVRDGAWGATGTKNPDAVSNLTNALQKAGINLDNAKVVSIAELTAALDRLIAAGVLTDNDLTFFFAERLADLGLKKLTDPEKQKIIQELCKAVGGTCKPPSRKSNPSCHDENYWGDTIGIASVQNINTSTGWVDGGTVWARPGDTVQFKIYYCWGAEAVFADDYHFARTEYWAGADNIYFKLSAEKSDAYLFGEKAQTIGSSKHVLTTPHNETIGSATGGAVPNSAVDQTGDYEFILYSPGSDDGSSYNCQIFDFAGTFMNIGYQIPGVQGYGCAAISQNGNVESDLANKPGSFSQSIEYDRIQAWQLYSHDRGGKCDGTCNYDNYGHYSNRGTPDERNSLWTKNDNKYDNPYPTLEDAQRHGGSEWGIVTRHQGDTNKHVHDCTKVTCGRSNPRQNYDYSCPIYKDDVFQKWDTCTGVKSVSYDAPCNSDGYCTVYDIPGTKYFEPTVKTYTEYLAKDIHPVNKQPHLKSTARVNVPYSYRTATNSYIAAGDVIYLGETVESSFTVNILPRIVEEVRLNEAYATLVDGFIQAVEFIADDIPRNSGGAVNETVQGDDLCNYFDDAIACKQIWKEGPKLNREGYYRGADYSHNETRVVPDDNPNLVGKKYCVAVGISTADSHGGTSKDPDYIHRPRVSGMSNPSAWRVSGVSCRTIAKKPNFQVWNGGLYTNGSIKTSTTNKKLDAHLGDSVDPKTKTAFGSWEEYFVVAKGNVRNFASGAAFGYSVSLKTPGGRSPTKNYCELTKKTISNANCSNGVSGNSGVYNTSQNIILERIRARYALGGNNTDYYGDELVEGGGARYIYKQSDDISISKIVEHFKDANMSNKDSNIYECNLYNNRKGALKMCQGKSANSEQTTSNYADGTLVIHTGGKVTIDRNICYGTGDCSNGNTNTVKLANNNEYFTSMYGLPQVLIIADGGIDITENVSQIDAWLITNDKIDTCVGVNIGSSSESACNTTLIVNGPVFAKSMTLNRTAGAYPGSGSSSGTVLTRNLSGIGSITSGEIFNLRPDALYWAYSQAQRFTQATVTYTRELAPRY